MLGVNDFGLTFGKNATLDENRYITCKIFGF